MNSRRSLGAIELYCEKVYDGRALFDLHASFGDKYPQLDMFEIISNRRFRSGKWYSCPVNKFSEMLSSATMSEEKMPLLEDDGKDVRIVSDAWPDPYFFEFFDEYYGARFGAAEVYDRAEIYDVGDGNAVRVYCSEVTHSIPDLWFDYGCGNHAEIKKVSHTLESNRIGGEIIIISHWDMDHSNCLTFLKTPVRELIAANGMPNTTKRVKAHSHLKSLGITIKTLGFGKIPGQLESSSCGFSNAEIMMPFQNLSSNKSSYVLVIKNRDTLLLAGDQNYNAICSSIPPSGKMNFLLPHHGGNAGNEPANLSQFLTGAVIVSCSRQKHTKAIGSISWRTIRRAHPDFTYLNPPTIPISY